MVQVGTPEEYFASQPYQGRFAEQVIVPHPVETRPVEGRVQEPPATQTSQTDHTPLIIGVCFFGTICFLAFLAWMWKQ